MSDTDGLAMGVDVGTSGVRCAVIDDADETVALSATSLPPVTAHDGRPAQDPNLWWDAVLACIEDCVKELEQNGRSAKDVEGIAVDGTSGTALICDADLNPLTTGLMYNSSGFIDQADMIDRHAPEGHMARGHSSALARLIYLQSLVGPGKDCHAMHQADWVTAKLCGKAGRADANNVLKAGYDPESECWPEWIAGTGMDMKLLPEVSEPGVQVGVLSAELVKVLGLAPSCRIHLGTTDSVAAFLATGVSKVGDAVSALGTTLAVKVISEEPVFDLASGVYSHRIGGAWMPGGASNSGCAAVERHMDLESIKSLTPSLRPDKPTGLDYYPLPGTGERFPINDPGLESRTMPRPDDDAVFLQGLFEGVAGVEHMAYKRLEELGAPWPGVVHTVGGGAANDAWTSIRKRVLGTTVLAAKEASAAAGVARLARGPLRLLAS